MLQQLLFRSPESYSVISFISDVWPLLLISLLFSAFLFLCWYFVFAFQEQKNWLQKNKKLITQFKILQLNLNDFGQQMTSCKNCGNREMQLWDYKKQLLVVRCRSCKMNYTYVKKHNKLLLKVLFNIEGVTVLLNKLIFYRHHAFGRLLSRKLEVDMAKIKATTTPLEILHFKAQQEYMITTNSAKDIDIFDWEVVQPKSLELVAI